MYCWDWKTVLLSWSQSPVMKSHTFMFDTFESREMQRIPLIDTTHERGRERSFYIPPILSISATSAFPQRSRSLVFFPTVYVYPLLLCCCFRFFLRTCCLFKDRLWHFHGIWCLCDCIKRVCGLRQQWTGTNPASHWTAPCLPPTSADLGEKNASSAV